MKAVFLDRDHTVINDPGYLADPAGVRLMPGAIMALRGLMGAGYKLVVVTNQSGVARGLLTEETLEKIHQEMRRQLEQGGVKLDGVYYCPFHPEGLVEKYRRESELRKPQPGMLLQAAKELDLDLAASWMIGDSPRDIEAGRRAGCKTILLRVAQVFQPVQGAAQVGKPVPPGSKPGDDEQSAVPPDFTAEDLPHAARIIIDSGMPSVAADAAPQIDTAPTLVLPSPDDSSAGLPARANVASPAGATENAQTLQEILTQIQQLKNPSPQFSLLRVLGVMFQIFALLAFGFAATFIPDTVRLYLRNSEISPFLPLVTMLLLAATVLQLAALAFFVYSRRD